MKLIWKPESRDEFEDPDEDVRRMFVMKLFKGLQEWNFGLFVQEIFKHEMKVKWSLDQQCLSATLEEGGLCGEVYESTRRR